MKGHFKHLHFDTFPMVFWGANFMFVCLFNQCSKYSGLLHKCSSQSENALGSHWAQYLALSPLVKMYFTFKDTLLALCALAIHTYL